MVAPIINCVLIHRVYGSVHFNLVIENRAKILRILNAEFAWRIYRLLHTYDNIIKVQVIVIVY